MQRIDLSRGTHPAAKRRLAHAGLALLALALLGIFAALSETVGDGGRFRFDRPILEAVHRRASPGRDSVMVAISSIGGAIGLTAIVAVLVIALWVRRRRGDARFLLLAVGGAQVIDFVAKLAFHRARPALWKSVSPALGYSFPSGHAMSSAAFAIGICALAWHTRWRTPALVLAPVFVVLVGLSRVYLGVHYPSDIAAGWCASSLWAGGLVLIRRRGPGLLGAPLPPPVATRAGS